MSNLVPSTMRILLYSLPAVYSSTSDEPVLQKKHSLSGVENIPRKKRSVNTLVVPASDELARSVFSSLAFADFDNTRSGQVPRLPPSTLFWETNFEEVPSYIHKNRVIGSSLPYIASTKYSMVYAIDERQDWAIKYHSVCQGSRIKDDPTLREAYFLQLLNAIIPHVTHEFIYLSAVFTPRTSSIYKLVFDGVECPTDPERRPPSVRYLITEKVGVSIGDHLHDWEDGRIPFLNAIDLGIEILNLLRDIHSINIVHGDIHPRNIAFHKISETAILIDFGRARIGPSSTRSLVPSKMCHRHLSPWQSSKSPALHSFRDDAFRAYLTIATMVYGADFNTAQDALCKANFEPDRFAKYMHFKDKTNIFDTTLLFREKSNLRVSYRFHLLAVLPTEIQHQRKAISALLLESLDHVRSLEHGDMPDYDHLIHLLETILDFAPSDPA